MSDDDTVLLTARVDERRKERVKERLEHGGLTREIRNLLRRLDDHASSEKARLKQELDAAREERDEWKQTREEANRNIERLDTRVHRLENELDTIRDREGEYEGHLKSIERMMHDEGASVFEDHGQVQAAADAGDCAPEDVINDLRERNPSLPDEQFSIGHGGPSR